MTPLTRWRYDNEYHDGLVPDPTGAWLYAADVEAREREMVPLLQWIIAQHSPLSHDYVKDERSCEECLRRGKAQRLLAQMEEKP
jgi:hypothetical protein